MTGACRQPLQVPFKSFYFAFGKQRVSSGKSFDPGPFKMEYLIILYVNPEYKQPPAQALEKPGRVHDT
jgi:hypothetical protein